MDKVERELLLIAILSLVVTFALAVLTGWRPARAEQKNPQYAVVILCDEGAVYRALDPSGGFIASGVNCVLADRNGGHATAGSIVVYDNANAAP